jgi:hypothetical protein
MQYSAEYFQGFRQKSVDQKKIAEADMQTKELSMVARQPLLRRNFIALFSRRELHKKA